MSIREAFAEFYSDMHKDAYGFRPHHTPTWESDEDAQREMDMMQRTIDAEIEAEREYQARAIDQFEDMVARLQRTLNQPRMTVIRWEMEAMGYNHRHASDVEMYYWHHSLPTDAIRAYMKYDHGMKPIY